MNSSPRTVKITESDVMKAGLCQCGCGQTTNIADKNCTATGLVKGQPRKYVAGHGAVAAKRSKPYYIVDSRTGCWNWQRATSRGYGHWWSGNKYVQAHRHFYEQAKGKIPTGMQLDHLCSNRKCVNPDHLEPVTNAENVRRGASSKLSHVDAAHIRTLRSMGFMQRDLALVYGLSEATVSEVCRGRSWRGR